ncbi:hypothetical protein WH50_05510 [Pokkaliibacter plantistimulans]|uniref:Virulence protein SciE type n=1 Tax=Pokkaliibacter plantistimulans TaxID=1635171 RepID=A0ABX5M1B8_9GAMM|nr:type VI secretion system accessory protein TagJ [Pokkaliibacter plantistimulans]PXF32189.1 hypothetical protein WH50_05510 [Pokkaliibacter plantistimulans]
MNTIKDLLQQGELSAAIEQLQLALRDDPRNQALRGSYIELLCIDGQLEKADQQLDMLVRQQPEYASGASNLRHLIRAAQARLDFYQGGDTSSLLGEADAEVAALLKLRLALVQESTREELERAALALEAVRKPLALTINEEQFDDLRDIDDSLCGFLELLGTDGRYYLVPWRDVEQLQLQPVSSLVEQVWRRAEIQTRSGAGGDVFVPLTYAASHTDRQKLGRETDWLQQGEAEVFCGVGLKQLLAGEEAINLADVQSLAPSATAVAV